MIKIKELVRISQEFIKAAPTTQDTPISAFMKTVDLGIRLSDLYGDHKFAKMVHEFHPNGDTLLKSVLIDIALKPFIKPIYEIETSGGIVESSKICYEVEGAGRFIAPATKTKEPDTYYNFNIHKDFNFQELSKLFYEYYGPKIFISPPDSKKRYNSEMNYSWTKDMKFESIVSKDKIIKTTNVKKIEEFLKKPGNYLFYGPPGTGKSSFIFSPSFVNKTCIKILASNLEDPEFVINCLKVFHPDVLLIEEMDKYEFELGDILILLERLRSKDMTVVITSNDISTFHRAMVRPGRIDGIIEFLEPTKEEIKEILEAYNKTILPEIKEKFVESCLDAAFTHAFVTDLAKKVTNENFEFLKDYIEFLKKLQENQKDT